VNHHAFRRHGGTRHQILVDPLNIRKVLLSHCTISQSQNPNRPAKKVAASTRAVDQIEQQIRPHDCQGDSGQTYPTPNVYTGPGIVEGEPKRQGIAKMSRPEPLLLISPESTGLGCLGKNPIVIDRQLL
jgi:hypothetical protein